MQGDPVPGLAWDDVRLFLAVRRARTLGQAGRAMGVDASTVSRRLDALERALSARLFERGRDGVRPTEAAEALLPVAEELEAGIARFAGQAEALERTVAGRVRVACPPDVAEVVIAPLVPALRERHPALRLEVMPGEAAVDLARREADLALRAVRPVRGDLLVTRLGAVRWIVVAGPELARRLGTLRDWAAAPWVGWGERLSGLAPARWLARHARTVDPVVRADGVMLQVALVRLGVGVAMVPEPTAALLGLAPVTLGGALREAPAAWPIDELFLVVHRALRDVPRVRVVWDLLTEQVGALLGEVRRWPPASQESRRRPPPSARTPLRSSAPSPHRARSAPPGARPRGGRTPPR